MEELFVDGLGDVYADVRLETEPVELADSFAFTRTGSSASCRCSRS